MALGRRGAPWTILGLELQGPYRVQQVEQLADTLKRTPEIRAADVWVMDGSDGFARLYYGKYFRRTDPETGRRTMSAQLRKDLDLLKQLGDTTGRAYFLQAMPVRMPTPDVGDPEWSLAHVNATYSLQVAVFEPTDDFWDHKRAAVEFCRILRKKGYEAYYYHGSASSMVTVGAFGPDAVIVESPMRTLYSAEVRALQRNELLKYNLWNGSKYSVRNNKREKVPVPSRLVEIPRSLGEGSK